MTSPVDGPRPDDELSRQRRKRESRLLDQRIVDFPSLTVADVVADVLAASDNGRSDLDVSAYLSDQGHNWQTVETVVAYLQRQVSADRPLPRTLP